MNICFNLLEATASIYSNLKHKGSDGNWKVKIPSLCRFLILEKQWCERKMD